MDDQLQIAFDSLTIVQVLHRLGYMDLREGAGQKNPWREDKKAGSFSVQRGYFKDHANDEFAGGHIKAVEFSRPDWSKKQCIDWLIEASGQTPNKQSAGAVKAQMKEKRETLYRNQQRKVEELPKLGMHAPGPMTKEIRDCWNEGQQALLPMVGKLAASRGWDESVMRSMVGQNKTSLPRLPWSNGSDNKRGWAWLIEKPIFEGGKAALVPVGFHARYKIFKKDEPVEKRWLYVPYVPATKPKRMTPMQEFLIKFNTKLPAYPFVLGDLKNPKLIIITEGQFDAVSVAAAFQWLENGLPAGVVIFGLRGVSSPNVFLAAYGAWVRRHKPFVWIIGDNDAAGRAMDRQRVVDAKKIVKEPSFIDRLRAQGCTVEFQWLEVEGCKDFNDVWRAHNPSIDQMHALADVAGCDEILKQVEGRS